MDALAMLTRLYAHAAWADALMLDAMQREPREESARELAHIVAAEEVWLARISGRAPRVSLWPRPSSEQLAALIDAVHAGYRELLARQTPESLDEAVSYVNSAGRRFETPLGEILLHVAMHGQYHRGKVNLLLRQGEATPAPTDFIAFARGAPAARTPVGE
jgi:uncharacterized damage-inducible protein DinB